MRFLLIFTFILFSTGAFAEECRISSPSDLASKLREIAQNGECETDSAQYRSRYDEYRGTAIKFHVISFNSSVEITDNLACLSGYNNEPLILMADSSLDVNISSPNICINDDNVIIDNIGFRTALFEISSSNNTILNSRLSSGLLKLNGDANRIISSEISESSGNGVEVSGEGNRIINSQVHNNSGHGVYLRAAALISHTSFYDNGGDAIAVERSPFVSPENLISVDAGDQWRVTGNLARPTPANGPWQNINLSQVRIELFLQNGPFVAELEGIDPTTRQFVFSVPKSEEYPSPVFVATAIDLENQNTSPFSRPLNVSSQNDWDNDGIPNEEEDYNHNGLVELGETDPRNPDTDGDGLTDGEERLHNGRIGEEINRGVIFADLSRLNPTNPDSDGDCLPDGLEVGVGANIVQPAVATMQVMMLKSFRVLAFSGSRVEPINSQTRELENLSPACRSILRIHNVTDVELYDHDSTTTTDPTNSDTDDDGLADGQEDWNFNGARDLEEVVSDQRPTPARQSSGGGTNDQRRYLETDPNNPDSDGDTILDGQEGDKNNNGNLDPNETNPLLNDTDGDGVADNVENRMGSLPNSCDSDGDDLSDGIETDTINPAAANPSCIGLQSSGTNFSSIGVLSSVVTDSDGDGLSDGSEDANHNGWLDSAETDPTTEDTDNDGISDYTESTLDVDRDGFPDVDVATLANGNRCSPPQSAHDVDCDDSYNARDTDSDNDGCMDRTETIYSDTSSDGVPDVWQGDVTANCEVSGGTAASSPGTSPSISPPSAVEETGGVGEAAVPFSSGGGDCSLVGARSHKKLSILPLFLGLAAIIGMRRGHKKIKKS